MRLIRRFPKTWNSIPAIKSKFKCMKSSLIPNIQVWQSYGLNFHAFPPTTLTAGVRSRVSCLPLIRWFTHKCESVRNFLRVEIISRPCSWDIWGHLRLAEGDAFPNWNSIFCAAYIHRQVDTDISTDINTCQRNLMWTKFVLHRQNGLYFLHKLRLTLLGMNWGQQIDA